MKRAAGFSAIAATKAARARARIEGRSAMEVALMTDENALQGGGQPGAVINEAAAVIRRLIEG